MTVNVSNSRMPKGEIVMGLIEIQAEFLQDVCTLVQIIKGNGFVVTGGELYRTRAQQERYFEMGLAKTMDSQHLKRLAIDLNFFKVDEEGKRHLTYEKGDLQKIGDYWESLNEYNQWGGNWENFLDCGHFERREG